MNLEIIAYLSGVAILISFIPYILDIFYKKTKPERMSWLIWAMLGTIAFFSQASKGASYSLIFTGVQAIGDLLIFLLAIKYGLGGLLKRDIIGLFGVLLSLVFWYITKEPAIALFLIIFIDAISAFLTIIKSYKKPETETISLWIFTFIGSVLACLAVGNFNFILLAFPFYNSIACLVILISIILGYKKINYNKI